MLPLFQFLPRGLKVWLLSKFNFRLVQTVQEKRRSFGITEICKTAKKSELEKLVPRAEIYRKVFVIDEIVNSHKIGSANNFKICYIFKVL
jgi:hypothetical protein